MDLSGTNDALPDSPIWQQLLTGWESISSKSTVRNFALPLNLPRPIRYYIVRAHSMGKRSIGSESEIIFEELYPPSVNNTQAQVIEMAVSLGQGLALETGKIQSVPYEEQHSKQHSKQSNDSTTLLRVAQPSEPEKFDGTRALF